MQIINHDQYLALRTGAIVLERDRYGEKVLKMKNGAYLKLFRRKRLLSSAAWYPYAQRFADNANILLSRGIPCPHVIAVYRILEISRDAVQYWPLEGKTLRQMIQAGDAPPALREQFYGFVEKLHETGIYFRSLHLGNVVLTPGNDLGLIDIADLRASKRPLSGFQRKRNMRHIQRDARDQAWLTGSTQAATPLL